MPAWTFQRRRRPLQKRPPARRYERAEPEQPAESDALGEKLAETETEAEALDHDPVLDNAISKAVLDHYADAVQPGRSHVESHVLLAQDDSSADTITVYLLVLQETYSADGETLTMENGSYVPGHHILSQHLQRPHPA